MGKHGAQQGQVSAGDCRVLITRRRVGRLCRCHAGATTTRFLESLPFSPRAIQVVAPGMNTTIQVRAACPHRVVPARDTSGALMYAANLKEFLARPGTLVCCDRGPIMRFDPST